MVTSSLKFTHTVTERFLRYVVIDTQSDPASPTCPSTEKQKDLGRLLAAELQAMGLRDAHLDDYGYVYATIPANTDKPVPVICFCSHMDTSPDCSGKDVKPQIVRNYRGGDIVLPGDPSQIIRAAEHPALKDQIGSDIVTSDGTTLLGADNKAGLAEIMDAAHFLIQNPQIKHGAIKILFTPDEEIGRGVDKADLKKLGADFAYTIDGETAGNIEDETFSADARHHHHRGRQRPSRFRQGQDGECDQDRRRHRRAAAERYLFAGNHRRQRGLPASDRRLRRTGASHAQIHRARFQRRRPEGKGGAAGKQRQGRDEGVSALVYRLEIKPQYRNMKQVIDRHPRSSSMPWKRYAAPA